MKYKTFIPVILLILISINSFSQSSFSIGVKSFPCIDLNHSTTSKLIFLDGICLDYNVSDKISLESGVLFTRVNNGFNSLLPDGSYQLNLIRDYLEFPMLCKIKVKKLSGDKLKFYYVAGLSSSFNNRVKEIDKIYNIYTTTYYNEFYLESIYLNLGISVCYKLSDKFYLNIEPSYKFDTYNSSRNNIRHFLGVGLNINYRF